MPLNRRQLITTAVATAAATGPTSRWATAATPDHRRAPAAPGGHYHPNAAPLHPTAFLKLPPGAVRARGWLAGQLQLQLEGLCGRYEEFSHFLDFTATGWVRPERGGWEEVPYWLRGHTDLAIVTGDPTALATTRRWLDAILATQQPDGFFGPKALRTSLNGGPDFWPFLPLIQALRSWQEYSGDTRVIPFLSKFFRYMNAQGRGAFDTSWIALRWGDGLDSVMWLYNRTGDAFLLDLVDKIHRYGADWGDNLVNPHNVNIAQGFREPAQFALRSGSATDTRDTYATYARAMDAYGQFPGGGFAGDENARTGHGDPRQGFETCGIVEFMASHQLLTRITGDPLWADRCEELAFNSLPASLDPSGKAAHYVTCANSVDLDNVPKRDRQFQNGFAMLAFLPGVDQYRCCPHNYGMGWPYFTEELWLATPDGGLTAAMYAPSEVRAKVADGTEVTFTEKTGYPFTDTVTLSLTSPKPLRFPLVLRVPAWCADPEIRVNGKQVTAPAGPAFTRIERTWSSGDKVTLRLPQRTAVRTWADNHNSVSVDHGPLTYSLRIGERYERIGGSDTFPEYAVHAASPWNYGLVLDNARPTASLRHRSTGRAPGDNPFTLEGTPLTITARARRIPEWTADDEHVVAPLQPSPARSEEPVQEVTLVPMGAARLRITSFPTAAPDGEPWLADRWYRIGNRHSGKVLGVDSMSTTNSAHVVQFGDTGTADHLWRLVANGDGWYRIRNQHSGKVLGVDLMSTANSAHVVQYDDNNTADHLWRLVPDWDGWYRIRNRHADKVLGVDGMSTNDSAHVVQYDDNGTVDHLWRLL